MMEAGTPPKNCSVTLTGWGIALCLPFDDANKPMNGSVKGLASKAAAEHG